MRIPVQGFLRGMNSNISPLIHPQDQPVILNGCTNAYMVGALTKDTGYSIIGSALQANKSIGGLFNFIQIPGTEKMLATIDDSTSDDTQLFYSTGSTWTEITTAETAWANFAGMKVEMESFIGYAFFVGYGATDGFLPVLSLTGTTTSTSVNVTNMAKGKFIKRYRDRLYVANCQVGSTNYPYRVYFSSVPSSGAITWSTTEVDFQFFDVDYSDEITGMGENWDRLIVFTAYKAYLYDQAQRKKVWDRGCSNHRTIKNSGEYMLWANGDGVWLSTGGQPQNISGEVMDFIRAGIPTSFFAEVIDEEYWLYVGDVTVQGVSYGNLALVFNIPLSAWRIRELGDEATIFAHYNDSGKARLWIGDNVGKVYNKAKYTDATLISADNTADISSNFELAPLHLQDLSENHCLDEIITYSNRAQGLRLQARAIDRNERILTPYLPIGEIKKYIEYFEPNVRDAVMIQICGSETGTNPYWSFYGYDINMERQSTVK